jgi:hypothetical protein
VVPAPATLKTNDDQVTQDAIVTEATGSGTSRSKRSISVTKKEVQVFDQDPGM